MYIEGLGNVRLSVTAGKAAAGFTFDSMEYGFYLEIREKLGRVEFPVLVMEPLEGKTLIVGSSESGLVIAAVELTEQQTFELLKYAGYDF